MESTLGDFLTRSTAGLAVLCYVLRLTVDFWQPRSLLWRKSGRYFWSAGWAFLLAHVVSAFHYHHGWSHADAYQNTARQTAEVLGIRWGGGVWINYLFLAFWTVDVAGGWLGRESGRKPPFDFWTVQILFAVIFVNATVVFGPSYWKGIAFAVGMLWAFLWWRRTRLARRLEL